MGRNSLLKKVLLSLKAGTFWIKTRTYIKWRYDRLHEKVCKAIYRRLPIIKNKIVFDSYGGKGYRDDPRILAEELIKHGIDARLVWLSFEKPKDLPREIKWVKYGSLKAYKEFSTAKIWVDNVRYTEHPPKRNGQYYIQTWHGTFGIKKAEGMVEDKLSPQYVKAAKEDGRITDLFLASCESNRRTVSKYFWYDGEIMLTEFYGVVPKADRLGIYRKVCAFFEIAEGTKLLLFAPTFRNDPDYNYFDLDLRSFLNSLKESFGGEWCVILKLHPNAADKQDKYQYDNVFVNGSLYAETDDLIYASEIVISDYSSVLFDAVRREIISFMYAPDLEKYMEEERGLVVDAHEVPPPLSTDKDMLINDIRSFDYDSYVEKCRIMNEKIGYVSDKRDISNVIERIVSVINSGQKNNS